MPSFTQANRPLSVTTPLGTDVLLLTGLNVEEGLSRLFTVRLELIALNSAAVAFDKLLGASITAEVELAGSTTPRQKKRYFNGVCNRFLQGERDEVFTTYYMELVPQLWLATRTARSRTFQHLSVKKILEQCLTGVKIDDGGVTEQAKRDYCVQYRETDFNFVSRLMEEEGIFYYFTHDNGSHTMVMADSAQGHKTVADPSTVTYRVAQNQEALLQAVVTSWQKVQELRSGKYTLWDYSFEKPPSHLDASKTIPPDVAIGGATHKLQVGNNAQMELYDYPGEYAQRYDGVDKGGGGTQDDVGTAAGADATRTVNLRMQEEAVAGVVIQGSSNAGTFCSGCQFTLKTLPNTLEQQSKADGGYILTGVQHNAHIAGGYRAGGAGGPFVYQNTFTAIPSKLPFRPARVTPRPIIHGAQTAVVVGLSASDDIFTDKYGRVKVQFPWDRDGKNNSDSSCWCRVGTIWASQQWGGIHIPRVGMEVIVAFEEGDPDRPIIVGSVYNANNMPPYTLPDNKTQSGVKSRSSPQGQPQEFNELRFEDKKGSEEVTFHAQKDFTRVVENNDKLTVGSSDGKYCPDGSQTISVYKDRTASIETGNESLEVKQGNRTTTLDTGNDTHQMKQGNREVKIDMGNDTLTISMGNQTTKLDMGASSTEAMQSIELKVGGNSIKIDQTGVTIQGIMVKVQGNAQTQVSAPMVQVSGDAMTQISGGIIMIG